MSTTNRISESLSAYGVHAFGGFAAVYGIYSLVKIWDQVNVEENLKPFSKHVAPLSSLTVGAAAVMLIAWSTKTQSLVHNLLYSGIAGVIMLCSLVNRVNTIFYSPENPETGEKLEAFSILGEGIFTITTLTTLLSAHVGPRAALDTVRPLMSSPISIICGIAGGLLGFLAARDPAAGQGPEVEKGRITKDKA